MTVADLMDNMDYGPAPESAAEALAWLDRHEARFGQFIAGAFSAPGAVFDSCNPATGEVLARLGQASAAEVDAAVAAARAAQPGWAGLAGRARARHLHALARLLQTRARLFAVLETLDTGLPIHACRDREVPLATRHFQHHAGLATLLERELPGHAPLGVCGQIIPWRLPLLMLAWKLAPALAAGNTVVLKPAGQTSLTALLFAETCNAAGLPHGVVNIVTGDGTVGEMIARHPDIDRIAFTGSTAVGRRLREITAGTGRALGLTLTAKSPHIVFEDADIDSAVEGLVDAVFCSHGQIGCAGARLLVQEGIAEDFHDRLRARMARLRIGDPLDGCTDIGAITDPRHLDRIAALVADGAGEGDLFQPDTALPGKGWYYPPTLITGLAPASGLMQQEIPGPVLVGTTFRTPSEAVELANDSRHGLAASVWSETLGVVLDVASKLAAGVVWVNGANLLDAAAGFGGLRESGFGREGGWEGLIDYLGPSDRPRPRPPHPAEAADRTGRHPPSGLPERPRGGSPRDAGAGSELAAAVAAARRAQPGWADTSAHARAQILHRIAETLSDRAEDIAARLKAPARSAGADSAAEVAAGIDRLLTWAAWADNFAGDIKAVPIRGTALALRVPVGVIGALCPEDPPFLGLISILGPAVAMGNAIVLVPSEPFPLAAADFGRTLESAGLPNGVATLVTGAHASLAEPLAAHLGLDAVWSFSSADVSETIERAAAGNLKRSWVDPAQGRDWHGPDGEDRAFLRAATDIRTIWLPWGA